MMAFSDGPTVVDLPRRSCRGDENGLGRACLPHSTPGNITDEHRQNSRTLLMEASKGCLSFCGSSRGHFAFVSHSPFSTFRTKSTLRKLLGANSMCSRPWETPHMSSPQGLRPSWSLLACALTESLQSWGSSNDSSTRKEKLKSQP